jgi:hypothetical protein
MYLMYNDGSHVWTLPAWDQSRSQLLCVDQAQQRVFARRAENASLQRIWSAPEGYEIVDIAVSDGLLWLFIYQPQQLVKRIITIKYASNEERIVAEGNFDIGQPLQLMDASSVLVLRMARLGSSWSRVVVRIDSVDGTSHELLTLSPKGRFFRLSPDGDTVFIVADDGQLQLQQLSTSTARAIPSVGLPGMTRAGHPFCFLDKTHVLLWREKDAMAPLGVYRMELRTGRGDRVFSDMLRSMTYLPECPFDKPNVEP